MPSSRFLNNFVTSNVDLECTFLSMHPGLHRFLDFDKTSRQDFWIPCKFHSIVFVPQNTNCSYRFIRWEYKYLACRYFNSTFHNTILDPTQKSPSACLVEPWLCSECNTENVHTVERCLLCDTPAPGWEAPKIANSNGDKYFDMLFKYLHANNFEAVLSSIFIISNTPYEAESTSSVPGHKNRHEPSTSGGDGTYQHASNNPALISKKLYRMV